MYSIGAATSGEPAEEAGLRIGVTARRAFDGPPAVADRPGHRAHLQEYLTGLVRPYRLDLRESAAGHSYGEMAAALVGELVGADRPVDLVVLAFAVPDVRPGRATATYLSEICPGSPLGFAICDQGSAAAFTGLRLLREYARTGGCRRSLLLVVEQAALPYDAGQPVELPGGHYAVGLCLEWDGPAGRAGGAEPGAGQRGAPARLIDLRQHGDVPPERAPELLAARVAELAGHGEPLVIADAGLLGGVGDVAAGRAVAAGRPLTGCWWELVGALTAGGDVPGAPVLLADYDRQLRYFNLATVEVGDDLRGGNSTWTGTGRIPTSSTG